MSNNEIKTDREHDDYDWCITEWYDGPLRSWGLVPNDERHTEPLVELCSNLAWTDARKNTHVRLSRAELQHALDMMDGKPVQDFHEDAPRVFSACTTDPQEAP
jgi:hypothetical protein